MDLKSSPRHSRQGFFQKVNRSGFAAALCKGPSNQAEIIDFSPESDHTKTPLIFDVIDERDYTALYSFLADQIIALSGASDAAAARMSL